MAKRRNLKKEKAMRNLAYARQFRKKTTGFQSQYKKYSNSSDNKQEDNKDEDKKDD